MSSRDSDTFVRAVFTLVMFVRSSSWNCQDPLFRHERHQLPRGGGVEVQANAVQTAYFEQTREVVEVGQENTFLGHGGGEASSEKVLA